MKKLVISLLSFLFVFAFCSPNLWAEDVAPKVQPEGAVTQAVPEAVLHQTAPEAVVPQKAPDVLTQAQELIDKGGLKNYKQALDLCVTAVKKDPNSFRANWMAAQACREYGLETEHLDLAGWKDICIKYSKIGRKHAEKAIKLEPKKPNGYYYYGMNVGIYADAVSIITALKEGLKDKTQKNFETAYQLGKTFDSGGPIVAIGRFWQVLPWPLGDKDKAMEYYKEYQKTKFYNTPDGMECHIYMAEILMDKWGGTPKKEAKKLLNQASKLTNDKYWQNRIKELLDDI